jgi:hypothetical protein
MKDDEHNYHILHITRRPIFYLKHDVLENGFSFRGQVESSLRNDMI